MNVKPLKIGKIAIENNVLLAPMAAYTDAPFRAICRKLGAGLTFTELVSAKGIVYDSPNTKKLLRTSDEETVKAAQIFGSDADVVYKACCGEDLASFQIVDVNMGCPVPKIVKNGEGSALLADILKAEAVVKAAVKSGKTVTAKIRIGIRENEPYITEEYAKMLEAAGAQMITVHGRTRERYYAGDVHFEEIARAKNAVKIPVIGNGGIFTVDDADAMMDKTGADGVMLARGAVKDPFLFCKLTGTKPPFDLYTLLLTQMSEMEKTESDRFVTLNLRKFYTAYASGRQNAKAVCAELYKAENLSEAREVLARHRTFFTAP